MKIVQSIGRRISPSLRIHYRDTMITANAIGKKRQILCNVKPCHPTGLCVLNYSWLKALPRNRDSPATDLGCVHCCCLIDFNLRRLKGRKRDELPRNGNLRINLLFYVMQFVHKSGHFWYFWHLVEILTNVNENVRQVGLAWSAGSFS